MSYRVGRRRTYSGEGPVIRIGRRRGGRRFGPPPHGMPPGVDPVQVVLRSGRIVSKRKIESAYRYLGTRAQNATSFSELDEAKARNDAVLTRLYSTKWASAAEKEYGRLNEIIRTRYDKLRETGSETKVGVGVEGLQATGERKVTKETPRE